MRKTRTPTVRFELNTGHIMKFNGMRYAWVTEYVDSENRTFLWTIFNNILIIFIANVLRV